MMNKRCIRCNDPSVLVCSRCGTDYCGRQCQLEHWAKHKLTCRQSRSTTTQVSGTDLLKKLINSIKFRIEGSIQVLISHNLHTSSGIEIKIDEQIEQMVSGCHWAHIKCIGDGPMKDPVPLTFRFENYTYESELYRSEFENNLPNPGHDYTVMFDM